MTENNKQERILETVSMLKRRGNVADEIRVQSANDLFEALSKYTPIELKKGGCTITQLFGIRVVEKNYMPPSQAVIVDKTGEVLGLCDFSPRPLTSK